MAIDYQKKAVMDSSGFVVLADSVPGIIQEIRYYSTYNFVGDRIEGYEEPCALMTKEAARALRTVSNKANAAGYRLKVFDAYRPVSAVRNFVLWGIDDLDQRMKPFFYPDLEKQELFRKGYIAGQSSHSRRNGFKPIDCEWWHFTLENEPYPDTYFEFPVSRELLRQ